MQTYEFKCGILLYTYDLRLMLHYNDFSLCTTKQLRLVGKPTRKYPTDPRFRTHLLACKEDGSGGQTQLQIRRRRLAHLLGGGDKVQHVVDQLKGQADVASVLEGHLGHVVVGLGNHGGLQESRRIENREQRTEGSRSAQIAGDWAQWCETACTLIAELSGWGLVNKCLVWWSGSHDGNEYSPPSVHWRSAMRSSCMSWSDNGRSARSPFPLSPAA